LGLYLIPFYLVAMVIQMFNPQSGLISNWWFTVFLPSTAPLYLMLTDSVRGLLGDAIGIFLIYQASLTLLGLVAAYFGVKRRRMVRESGTAAVPRKVSPAGSHSRTIKHIADWYNPVYVREWRWGLFPKRRGFWLWVITGGIATLLISILFIVAIQVEKGFLGSGQEVMIAAVYLHGMVVLLALPASLSNILTKEREHQTGLLLSTTIISPGELALGKLLAAYRLGFLAWSISLIANLLLVGQLALNHVNPYRMLLGHVTLLFCVVGVATVTVFASTSSRKTRSAVALSGFLGFMVVVGFSLGLVLLFLLMGGFSPDTNNEGVIAVFFALSPAAAYYSLFESPQDWGQEIWTADLFYLLGITLMFGILTRSRIARSIRSGFET
jgi:ABC-type transport system involved in multi-copper enzyme maturation permease subunit